VWWDSSLLAGEYFRHVILGVLAAAQCVFVVWSPSSVGSDWVVSEAERGKAQSKLLPLRVRELNPRAIPMPFGVLHTELADQRENIAAAVAKLQLLGGGAGASEPIEPPRPQAGNAWADDSLKPSFATQPLAGTEYRDLEQAPLLTVVPAGGFVMGSPANEAGRKKSEGPPHRVRIAASLAVGKYPVTFREWEAFAGRTQSAYRPPENGWGGGERPVINVSWSDALAYCEWLSISTGHVYRLLSEAEWEYCCRAGATTRYAYGQTISSEQANFNASAHPVAGSKNTFRSRTTPVGQFEPNAFGLADMHGNVSEWTQDSWYDDYTGAPNDGRPWNGLGARHVLRGGSWYDFPQDLRSAHRAWAVPSERSSNIGFRVCRAL
jgi:formylglycine-generating enzyme required for sulfatase activity